LKTDNLIVHLVDIGYKNRIKLGYNFYLHKKYLKIFSHAGFIAKRLDRTSQQKHAVNYNIPRLRNRNFLNWYQTIIREN